MDGEWAEVTEILPPVWYRRLWAGMGILYVAMGVAFAALAYSGPFSIGGQIGWLVVAVVAAALGVAWAARSRRMNVELTDDELVLHGYLFTRRIPRRSITGLAGGGSIVHWTGRTGTPMTTPLLALGPRPGQMIPPLERKLTRARFDLIVAWVGAPPPTDLRR